MHKNPEAIKNGWKYSNNISSEIGLHYAKKNKNDQLTIMYEDRVIYTNNEIKSLIKIGGTTKNIHNIKKIFKGVIL